LIGIRFGAAIACKVGAEKKPAPFAIGYWDPVLAGVAYMSDMQSLQERLEAADDYINFTTSPSKALMGFPFSEVQRKSIATMDISDSFSGQQTPYFVVHSEDTPRTREYIDKCKSGPFFRGACHVPHESDWLAIQTYDNIIMSPTIMDKLIAFMAQQEQ
jgi:hypothetical protein